MDGVVVCRGNPIAPKCRYFIPVLKTRWVKSEPLCIGSMRRAKFNTTLLEKSDCFKCFFLAPSLKKHSRFYLLGYVFIYWNIYAHAPN